MVTSLALCGDGREQCPKSTLLTGDAEVIAQVAQHRAGASLNGIPMGANSGLNVGIRCALSDWDLASAKSVKGVTDGGAILIK
ncbi:hypothetical protein ABIB58_001526 [Brevundimonas sp. UYEF29]|uniref:hypothetical protein n=1 Tax=Brevundimonas sp. UYEF29 TaxID=3156346 RepID=UPI00339132BE